jgi:hypothetical protein
MIATKKIEEEWAIVVKRLLSNFQPYPDVNKVYSGVIAMSVLF